MDRMDSGLLTIWQGSTGPFEVRRQAYLSTTRNLGCPTWALGWPGATGPPPLWIGPPIRLEPRRCSQGKAPSPRCDRNPASRSPTTPGGHACNRGPIKPHRSAGALQSRTVGIPDRGVRHGPPTRHSGRDGRNPGAWDGNAV